MSVNPLLSSSFRILVKSVWYFLAAQLCNSCLVCSGWSIEMCTLIWSPARPFSPLCFFNVAQLTSLAMVNNNLSSDVLMIYDFSEALIALKRIIINQRSLCVSAVWQQIHWIIRLLRQCRLLHCVGFWGLKEMEACQCTAQTKLSCFVNISYIDIWAVFRDAPILNYLGWYNNR